MYASKAAPHFRRKEHTKEYSPKPTSQNDEQVLKIQIKSIPRKNAVLRDKSFACRAYIFFPSIGHGSPECELETEFCFPAPHIPSRPQIPKIQSKRELL
eukprot:1463717-Amphidinium_carterae.1